MRKFANRLKDDRGMSLIEVIASLTLLSLVMATIYGVITFGFNSYHRVTIENSLRDEADLVMSSIITEMYKYGPDEVSVPSNASVGVSLSKTVDGRPADKHSILIKDGKVYIGLGEGVLVELQSRISSDSSITVDCGGLSKCKTGLVDIKLVLEQSYANKPQKMKLESKFGF
ncbi:prepilin-type N-terminal cleavage/methylation domain-containing protein [Cohnella endophytica]|uniref:Prepilin-type N-terminal cleavage/methylation domain-containing protein n=1 Tax=Cohnella endophytica TaxID=2419778 RepID=A0A494Y3A6_9BACL|nr:prepilin-type N-terminal cleavage/methylation domain-containing protein [Cohnella endophytica]RKP57217.1 prepilin-type N-terminal cleavage/methylation domain-containing protein [Cohnella endophytica]